LQRLEKVLGYALFTRTPNGVQLTPSGQKVVSMEDQMLHPDAAVTPVLRIMSGRAFVSTDVPSCLRKVIGTTSVHLKVRMGMYDEMTNALLAQQVDFCFLGEPIYHPSVRQVEFSADIIDLVVPEGHHFTREFPGIPALGGEPLVAFGRASSPFRRRVTNLLAQSGVYPPIRMELDSIDGIKAMVGHGLGISFLPRRTLHDAKFKHYAIIPLDDPSWHRPTLLAYPDAIAEKPLTQQFVKVVTDYYRELDKSSVTYNH
jgi:DNA-binding transcriptional LysR family regulator